MVQETRLDLSRPAAIVGLAFGLAVSVTAFAQAQPLMPNPGLTSLLQPQRLDRSRPLMPADRTAGTRSGVPQAGLSGGTPCDRRGAVAQGGLPPAPAGSSLYGGGSGAGDYGRYIPGAPPPGDPGAKKPASAAPQPGVSATVTADRPLYSGVDRPLWDSGERRTAAAAGTAFGKPASPGQTGSEPSGAVSGQPNTIPAPVRDRPLWARADPTGPADSDSGSGSATGSLAAGPCTTSSAPLLPR